jgi:hypothetical protein
VPEKRESFFAGMVYCFCESEENISGTFAKEAKKMAENNDRHMDKLSRAIVEAILSSKDVKQALARLKKLEGKIDKTMMVFVLKLDSLTEAQSADFTADSFTEEYPAEEEQEEVKKPPARRVRRKGEIPEVIDGRPISASEKKFLEYLSERFDTQDWLKKHGISLD